ncbi:MAG: prolyl oligopeptidase family serine peptidase [Acidimicrobiales bacterium]
MNKPVTPRTTKENVTDYYHGEEVPDPYRWLEDTGSAATIQWITAQNQLTEEFLAAVPRRGEIRSRLHNLADFPKLGVPFERGGKWFQFRNKGLEEHAVLFVASGLGEPGRAVLAPRELSSDDTVAVTAVNVTNDGTLLAFATSGSGSDWMTWRVREVKTGRDRDDLLEWSKFSSAAWLPDNSGFYYNALRAPQAGHAYVAQNRRVRVMFHRLGTPQSEDELLFEAPDEGRFPHGQMSEDGRYLVVTISRGTFQESQVRVVDLQDREHRLQPLVPEFIDSVVVVTNVGETFYLLTDFHADKGRLVAADLHNPAREEWREVIAEQGSTLAGVYHFGDRLVCHRLEDGHSGLTVHEMDGSFVCRIELPEFCAVSGLEGRAHSKIFHFEVTAFSESGALYSHDLLDDRTRLISGSSASVHASHIVTEQVFVKSPDGTRIPVFLTHRRDVSPTGSVPTLLYGYGGFRNPVLPHFSITAALFVEQGGLYAVASLRGGGEYGRAWYEDGRMDKKQHVFDDFAACASWLSSSGWTRASSIAINGRSNGGLLVAACLTQHPELYGAAVPEAGVLDLLRFHKFTIGRWWVTDYGNPDDPAHYQDLRRYSPLHNITPGTHYPPTLVMTGDHDDRVVPGHSLKFAAALQEAQQGDAPILLRVDSAAGHGVGKPTTKLIDERADVLTFLDWALKRQ